MSHHSTDSSPDSMTSKIGDSPRKSAAAYLLFYRRRSDKPLGPDYLQKLVTDFRNPPQNNSADEAYESDSGEGRLGDLSSTLRGSSSNSVEAGAGASKGLQHQAQNTLRDGGNGSAGQQAGQNQKPRTQGTSDDEGIGLDDDEQEPTQLNTLLYGNKGNQTWSFGNLEVQNTNADTDTEMPNLKGLRDNDAAADVDSNAAEQDSDRERFADIDDQFWGGSHNTPDSNGWNDPNDDFMIGDTSDDWADNHAMYSAAHDYQDTKMTDDDQPPVDIKLSDNSSGAPEAME